MIDLTVIYIYGTRTIRNIYGSGTLRAMLKIKYGAIYKVKNRSILSKHSQMNISCYENVLQFNGRNFFKVKSAQNRKCTPIFHGTLLHSVLTKRLQWLEPFSTM
jgi:hypothetical protein